MSAVSRGIGRRCPRCGEGALFKDFWNLHDSCSVCHARYFRDPGVFVAPTAMGYGVGAIIGVGGGALLIGSGHYFRGAEYVLMFVAGAVTIVSFPFLKGAWVGMLCDWGLVYPDPPPPSDVPPPPPLGNTTWRPTD